MCFIILGSMVLTFNCPVRNYRHCKHSRVTLHLDSSCSNTFSLTFPTVVDPASNLQVTEMASKSMRVTWDASPGDITGYKLTLIPMLPGMKRQELYIGPTQTSINVRDLSPETEYEISLYALKGLTPSEPTIEMGKTQPIKVSTGKTFSHACHLSLVILRYSPSVVVVHL